MDHIFLATNPNNTLYSWTMLFPYLVANYMYFSLYWDCLFLSQWHRHTGKKTWVLPAGVEPMTFWILAQMFTAVKRKNLRHIRLSVPWKSVSVQSVYGAKFVRKLCWKYSDKTKYEAIKSEVNKQELFYRYPTFKASLSRNCFIFWRFEKVFWISR